MKQTKNLWGGEYTAPTLEVLDIAVEQGFASSIEDGEGVLWDTIAAESYETL